MTAAITEYKSPGAGVRVEPDTQPGIDFSHAQGHGPSGKASLWMGHMGERGTLARRVLEQDEVEALRDALSRWLAENKPSGRNRAVAAIVEADI